jgi:hypothetical protein
LDLRHLKQAMLDRIGGPMALDFLLRRPAYGVRVGAAAVSESS